MMSSSKIAVIFPSRGLAFSQTCEELLENLEGYDYDVFFSHGLPIPDCFNKPLKTALRGPYTHFWFVEDDMILPKDTLKRLLAVKAQAITCDYPLSRAGKPAVLRDPDGNAIYGGTGCLLVTREFIEQYKQPVFRTGIAYDMHEGEVLEMAPRKVTEAYGLHDVDFYLRAPTPVKVSKLRCGQRKLLSLGQAGTNNGEHLITNWTDLNPTTINLPKVKNRNVILDDGTITFMDIKRARVLAKEGRVTIRPHKYVEIV